MRVVRYDKSVATAAAGLLGAALAMAGCGSSPTPGPTHVGEDGEVAEEVRAEFDEAAAFYRQQEEEGWDESRCEAAASRFESVAEDHPQLVEARFNVGQSYHQCGLLDRARDHYEEALDIEEHGPSIANIGKIYWARGDEDEARARWEEAVEVDPRSVAARNNLAWLMIREMRETDDAAEFARLEDDASGHLSRVLAVDNDNIEAYALYSLLYLAGAEDNPARLDIAELLVDEGSDVEPDYAPFANSRGLIELHRNNVSEALSHFQRAVSLDPSFLEARMNVGNIVLGFRNYREARNQFQAVLESEPENYDALIGLGIALRGLEEFDEAEETYRRAASLNSNRGLAYFNLGVLYKDFYANQVEGGDLEEIKNTYAEAREYFEESLGADDLTSEWRQEARTQIEDCDELIEQLEEILEAQAEAQA